MGAANSKDALTEAVAGEVTWSHLSLSLSLSRCACCLLALPTGSDGIGFSIRSQACGVCREQGVSQTDCETGVPCAVQAANSEPPASCLTAVITTVLILSEASQAEAVA